MQATDILTKMGGLQNIAQELGISQQEAASGAGALLPAILGGFKKQAEGQGGAEGLGGLLSRLGGGSLLDNVLDQRPTDVSRGNNVLGEIFGTKDVSRTVAQNASARSGVAPDVLKKMLPMLAMAVTGFMSKQQAQPGAGGGLGGLLSKMTGGRSGGLGGLAAMLDQDGDGNPLDDILGMGGKATR